MKKHFLGFSLFCLILIGNSFLFSNVEKKLEFNLYRIDSNFKEEVLEEELPLNLNDISFEILNVKYNELTNTVTNDLRFYWKGKGKPPSSITVNTLLTYTESNKFLGFNSEKVNLIFGDNKAEVLIFHTENIILQGYISPNYYSSIWLSEDKQFNPKFKKDAVVKKAQLVFESK